MLTIAVDAMGGDNAPKAEVEGAVEAARTLGVRVILVGPAGDSAAGARSNTTTTAACPSKWSTPASSVTMEDSAARAVRTKRDSSMRVASRLVRDGIAQGFVSAGNTGAVMATAKMVQGVVPGVDRPALAGIFPTLIGKPVVVVDVGANVDCSPRMLAQFAVMGEIYSRVVLHQPRPARRACSPSAKRSTRATTDHARATPLLKSLPSQFHRQRGRPRYLHRQVDVMVCDGFIGNVALKVSEGLVDMVKQMLRESLEATITRQDRLRCCRAPRSPISRSAWIIPNTAARRCWACAASASSATAAPTPTPSRTPFAWRPNSPAARSTSGSRTSYANGQPNTSPSGDVASRLGVWPLLSGLLSWRFQRAQNPNNVKWSLALEPATAAPGSQVLARLDGQIDPGWHLYSLTSAGGHPHHHQALARMPPWKRFASSSRRPRRPSIPTSSSTPRPMKVPRLSCWNCN